MMGLDFPRRNHRLLYVRKRPASGLAFIEPQQPTLVDHPPEGGEWIHEIKFDGYRSQIIIDHGEVRVFTRRGHDWTDKYRLIAEAAREIDVDTAIIDGEILVADQEGRPKFHELRSSITRQPDRLVFMAFDLLNLNGEDLQPKAVERRRGALEGIVPGNRIQFSGELDGKASDIFAQIDRVGLEGMVSKRKGSRYRSGPSTAWVKAKCYDTGVFDIIGVQRERGKPAMVLMQNEGRYIGGAFVTLPKGVRERLWERVQSKTGAKPPKGLAADKAEWLLPGLRGRVRYLRGEESLRHAHLQSFEEIEDGPES